MSQLDSPMPPLEPAVRPTSVTVMAVIGIIFGALGFLCSPLALIPYFITLPTPNPFIDSIKDDNALFMWTIAVTVMGWFLSILLLVGSIWALMLREWARQILLGWSVASSLLTVAQFLINVMVVFPKMAEIAKADPKMAAGSVSGWIGAGIGLALGLGIPILMLFFMTRPHVKDAFARGARRII